MCAEMRRTMKKDEKKPKKEFKWLEKLRQKPRTKNKKESDAAQEPTPAAPKKSRTPAFKGKLKKIRPKRIKPAVISGRLSSTGKRVTKMAKTISTFIPRREEKEEPLLDGNVKILPQFCIQTKLIGCFIIPVIMIILLGIVSFTRSSHALNESYESAITQTMNMAKEYFSFVFSNIESDMNVYLLDTQLGDYYSGEFSTNETQLETANTLKKKYEKAQADVDRQREGSLGFYKAYKEMSDAYREYEQAKQIIDEAGDNEQDAYATLNTSVSNKVAANQFIGNIFIFKENQNIISSQPRLRATAVTTEDYTKIDAGTTGLYSTFLETELGKKVTGNTTSYHWSGTVPELDNILSVSSSDYLLRVAHDLSSTSDAVIIVDIRKDAIMNILRDLNLGEGSYVGLITGNGEEFTIEGRTLVTDTEDGTDSDNASDAVSEPVYTSQEFYQDALNSEQESGSSYVRYDGSSYLFTYQKLGTTGIMLCSLVPSSLIVASANSIRVITIILVLVSCLIAIIVGTLISKGFSKSINATIYELDKVSHGDLTVEFRTKRRDEFALLYGSCNDMLANIRGLIMEVESVYEALTVSLSQVDSSSTTFSQTTKDIQTSIHEVETGVGDQTESATACLTEMDSLFGKINNVNENANEIGSIAASTQDAIASGITTMDNLNEKTKSTTEITENIILTINQLSAHSRNIGLILSSINDIAQETNLLSLNASIEAARAGSAGKGFSVVANQIRKLADQCLTSAGEISDIVNEITVATKKAVKTAESAEEIVEEQVEAVADTAQSFQELKLRIEKLSENLESIQSSSKDMEVSGSSTLKAMENISAILEETLASVTSVATGTDKQSEALTSLNDASSQLVERADHLGSAISKFKTKPKKAKASNA